MWSLGRISQDSDSGSDDDDLEFNSAELATHIERLQERGRFQDWAAEEIQSAIDMRDAPAGLLAGEPFVRVSENRNENDRHQAVSQPKRVKRESESDHESDQDSNSDSDIEDTPNLARAKVLQVMNAVHQPMAVDSPPKSKSIWPELNHDEAYAYWKSHKLEAIAADAQIDIIPLSQPPNPVSLDVEHVGGPALLGTYRLAGLNSMCIICRTNTLDLCTDCESTLSPSCSATRGKCGHVFHTHCIKQWLSRSFRCPADNSVWDNDSAKEFTGLDEPNEALAIS